MKALACAAALLAAPASACDFALLFSLDASGSVDAREWQVQVGGLAAALEDPEVGHFVVSRDMRLAVFQWSSEGQQDLTINWTSLPDEAALAAFTARLRALPRRWASGTTAIASAMQAMAPVMAAAPCAKRVIDISGDGESNEFLQIEPMRDALGAAGVAINALAIEPDGVDWFIGYKNLADYYQHKVIIGEGAFVEQAEGFDDYPRAILQKLRREILEPIG